MKVIIANKDIAHRPEKILDTVQILIEGVANVNAKTIDGRNVFLLWRRAAMHL